MTESKTQPSSDHRSLKPSHGILYGIGCGIGGSIFVLLGAGIDTAGSGILLSLFLGGILIFFTALNYAELSTSLPMAGGSYNFSKEGLGGFLAFIIGFFLWIANISACSFSAHTFALVIEEMLKRAGIASPPFYIVLLAIIVILFTSLVIFRTQKIATKSLIYLTIILLGIFGIFIFSGLVISQFTSNFDLTILSEPLNPIGIVSALPLLFIFFTSITSNLAYLNSNLKNPSKNIPKVNILTILIALVIYLTIAFVVLVNVNYPPSQLGNAPLLLPIILENILGPFGFIIMIFAALISTMIAINAALGSGVSIITALARDRYIPKKFKEVKKRAQMPALALLITVVIAIIFTYFAGIGLAAETTTFIYFFGLAFVNYAAVKLRRKRKELDRPFKAPFFPVLPYIISGTFLVFALFFFSTEAVLLGIIILSIGVGYFLLTISDRASKSLTLAGIKSLLVILISFSIWLINNFSVISPELVIINRILIVISVFIVGTVIFDIIPLREVVYFFIKKVDKGKVAINLGNSQIIEPGKTRSTFIHLMNFTFALLQIISGIIFFIISSLILNGEINITELTIGSTSIPQMTIYYLFNSILIIFGIVLVLSGILLWFTNRELKSFGI
ncbi:MAG: amino acid permease [Candidatus Lokiarchaeota archaeon]|nr:amino acid permease [Candidatus Lokiarchaeota archaeon]